MGRGAYGFEEDHASWTAGQGARDPRGVLCIDRREVSHTRWGGGAAKGRTSGLEPLVVRAPCRFQDSVYLSAAP